MKAMRDFMGNPGAAMIAEAASALARALSITSGIRAECIATVVVNKRVMDAIALETKSTGSGFIIHTPSGCCVTFEAAK